MQSGITTVGGGCTYLWTGKRHCHIYRASTSELFGKVRKFHKGKQLPFYPQSVFGRKIYGFWIMKDYRESYDMYCCNGICSIMKKVSEEIENFVTVRSHWLLAV